MRSLYQDLIDTQQNFINSPSKDMKMARNAFVKSLIQEHATKSHRVDQLPLYDQQILLSYVTEPSEYEFYCANPVRLEAAIKENYTHMQNLINDQLNREIPIIKREFYGIRGNEDINFRTLEDAEHYLMENYQEYYSGKDSLRDFSENMIWEDAIIQCRYCNKEDEESSYNMKLSECGEFYSHNECAFNHN